MNLVAKAKKLVLGPPNPYSTIPLTDPALTHAKELIPSEWWANTWVAGSAATRFGQHSDVDVWICDLPHEQDLWTVLPQNVGKPIPEAAEEDYEHLCVKVHNEPGLQIMSLHESIHYLLSRFDISVHCGAVQILTGSQLKGSNYSDQVTICNYFDNAPILTLERYLRFGKRYKDFSRAFDPKVQKCASEAFNLKTEAQVQEMLKYCQLDRGL